MRDHSILISDIEAAIGRIETYIGAAGRDEFLGDEKTQSAVLWELIAIGEATKGLPDLVKRDYPDVPWKQMMATRDFLAHGYYRVEGIVVWDIVEKDLPKLKQQIRKIRAGFSGGGDEAA